MSHPVDPTLLPGYNDQMQVRLDEIEAIRNQGIDPYPSSAFPVNAYAADILENYPRAKLDYKHVNLAGRIMTKRVMGKASFAVLQDGTGRIQLYVAKDDLGEESYELFKRLTSLGDHVGVEGYVFTTKMGETTVHVTSYTLLSKSIRPLPQPKEKDGEVYDAFSDPELRHRMRYVDLVVNDHVKNTFICRSKAITALRRFLDEHNILEVETPVLQPIYGGALARPFETHHNTLDMKLYLRIADELYLKRLIVGGFSGVYEISKDFRNEGMSRFHNPEFTMLEVYVAYQDYRWMMDFVERMLHHIVKSVHNGQESVDIGTTVLNFHPPFARYTMYEAIRKYVGVDVEHQDEVGIRVECQKLGIHVDNTMARGKLIDELFSIAEKQLIQPTFITDYPVEMSPLAKQHRDNPALVERFELICNGKEVCNAYSELNDPLVQRQRFVDQLALRDRGDDEAMILDEDFLRALEYGMPPTAGLGMGIDRLVMMLTGAPSIQEVILFPQMRPEAVHVAEE